MRPVQRLCRAAHADRRHPAAEGAYDRIVSGVATEMIPRLFLTGSWGVPLRADLEV